MRRVPQIFPFQEKDHQKSFPMIGIRRIENQDAIRFQYSRRFLQRMPRILHVLDELSHVYGVEKSILIRQSVFNIAPFLVGI